MITAAKKEDVYDADASNEQVDSKAPDADALRLVEYRKAGDRDLFTTLVSTYEGELMAYLRKFLGNADDAGEVFQNTWLQVHLKCDQFEGGKRFRPWLYRIATNQAIDFQRRNKRHKAVRLDQSAKTNIDHEGINGTVLDLAHGMDANPSDIAVDHENADAVRECMDALPDPLKNVLVLIYYQGLKYREAADELSIPVGTVKSRAHSAISKLHEAMTGRKAA